MDWYMIAGILMAVIGTAGGLIFGAKVLARFKKIEDRLEDIEKK